MSTGGGYDCEPCSLVTLSGAEHDRVLELLEHPPAPSPRLRALFRASEEELQQAARRVAEADAILGLARSELSRCNPVFPELHDDLPW